MLPRKYKGAGEDYHKEHQPLYILITSELNIKGVRSEEDGMKDSRQRSLLQFSAAECCLPWKVDVYAEHIEVLFKLHYQHNITSKPTLSYVFVIRVKLKQVHFLVQSACKLHLYYIPTS